MKKKYVSGTELTKLVIKLSTQKDAIQAKLNSGQIESIAELAKLEGVPYSTMRRLAKDIGINGPRTHIRKPEAVSLTAIIAVIHRICVELKIDHKELLPYLHNTDE